MLCTTADGFAGRAGFELVLKLLAADETAVFPVELADVLFAVLLLLLKRASTDLVTTPFFPSDFFLPPSPPKGVRG